MDVQKLPMSFVKAKLKALDLLNEDGTAVTLGFFRNRASIQKYGKAGHNQLKVVYVGQPKDNMFGFYVNCNPDPLAMKEAYKWYLELVKEDFGSIDIHWGNMGYPLSYQTLRAVLPDDILN